MYHLFPIHRLVERWRFSEYEEEEAQLANSVAYVADKNGISEDELLELFPCILRILKSKSEWSGLK